MKLPYHFGKWHCDASMHSNNLFPKKWQDWNIENIAYNFFISLLCPRIIKKWPWLAVSPEHADQLWVHVLLHDHAVGNGEVAMDKAGTVGDISCAEVALQILLHFWKITLLKSTVQLNLRGGQKYPAKAVFNSWVQNFNFVKGTLSREQKPKKGLKKE